jgi:site-specific recombinase XerD
MYDEKYPDFRNLLPKIEKPAKEAVRKKSVFTKEELDRLMTWLGEQNKVNEQCLLATMMASGARVSELGRFTTTMIDENNTAFESLFLETTEEMQVKGRGVNGKSIVRYIIKDLFLPYYKKWLPVREKIMKENNQTHNYIFVTKTGEPAGVATFRGWMEKWDTVLDKHLYAHSMRHFWCSYLLKAGLEKELVQDMQKWSSDTLVDLYNDNTAKDRKWEGLGKLKVALEQEQNIIDNTYKK